MAAVFAPGTREADVLRAVARADVEILRFGAVSNIAIVAIDEEADMSRLRRSGAWFTLPPGALGGCLLGPPIGDARASSPRKDVST